MAKKAKEVKVDANISEAFAKVMSNEKAFNAAKSAGADANKVKAEVKIDSYNVLIVDCLLAGDEAKVSEAGTIDKAWKNKLKVALIDNGGCKPRVYNEYVANIGNLIMLEREEFNNLVVDNPKADDLYGPVAFHLDSLNCNSEAKIREFIKNRIDPKTEIDIAAEKIAKLYFDVWKNTPEKMSRLKDLVETDLKLRMDAESERREKLDETNKNADLMDDLKSKADAA